MIEKWERVKEYGVGGFLSQYNDRSDYKYTGTGFGIRHPNRNIETRRTNAVKSIYLKD